MRLLRLLLTSLLRVLPDPDSPKTPKVAVMPRSSARFARPSLRSTDPAHECVDRPWLGCPACFKATGDPFATVNSHRQRYSKTG
jgi:hypothetical protein